MAYSSFEIKIVYLKQLGNVLLGKFSTDQMVIKLTKILQQ